MGARDRFVRFVARVLDTGTIEEIAPNSWVMWGNTTEAYRGVGYRNGQKPPHTGDLLVQSPYADWFNLTWGLTPSQDMPKWRWMYRSRPEIRRGVDIKVILAVGRGFKIVCKDNADIELFCNNLLKKLNHKDVAQKALTDMEVYGFACFEKVRALPSELQENEKVEISTKPEVGDWSKKNTDDQNKTTLESWLADVGKVDRWLAQTDVQDEQKKFTDKKGAGELVALKSLDPMFIRINRDAFGNVIGYVQWGLTPVPQSIYPDKMVFLPWMPKSTVPENAYGNSILQPVQRHVSLLIQAEEDMKVYWHQYAKPMLVVKAGTQEKPYPVPRLNYLQAQFAARQPNTDAIVPGDVTVEMLQAGTGATTATFAEWASYLREKIYETIGVPSVLMNLPDQTSRAISDISLQAFIAEEQMAQQLLEELFMDQVIIPEVREKFGDKIPAMTVVWLPIVEEDKNKKGDRLIKQVGKPFVTINEARTEMGYDPIDDKKYDEIPESADTGAFGQPSKNPEQNESGRTGPREENLMKRDKGQES